MQQSAKYWALCCRLELYIYVIIRHSAEALSRDTFLFAWIAFAAPVRLENNIISGFIINWAHPTETFVFYFISHKYLQQMI